MDNVRRGIEWLKYKGLVSVSINKDSIVQLVSEESKDDSSNNKTQNSVSLTLPERRIVDSIGSKGKKMLQLVILPKFQTYQILNLELE